MRSGRKQQTIRRAAALDPDRVWWAARELASYVAFEASHPARKEPPDGRVGRAVSLILSDEEQDSRFSVGDKRRALVFLRDVTDVLRRFTGRRLSRPDAQSELEELSHFVRLLGWRLLPRLITRALDNAKVQRTPGPKELAVELVADSLGVSRKSLYNWQSDATLAAPSADSRERALTVIVGFVRAVELSVTPSQRGAIRQLRCDAERELRKRRLTLNRSGAGLPRYIGP